MILVVIVELIAMFVRQISLALHVTQTINIKMVTLLDRVFQHAILMLESS